MAVFVHQLGKSRKLFVSRQIAHQQQIHRFLICKAVFLYGVFYEIFDIISAEYEFARYRRFFAFVYYISVNVTYVGKTSHYAGAVGISQTSFYHIFIVVFRVDGVIGNKLLVKHIPRCFV